MMTCDNIALAVDLYRGGFLENLAREVVIFYFHNCQALV